MSIHNNRAALSFITHNNNNNNNGKNSNYDGDFFYMYKVSIFYNSQILTGSTAEMCHMINTYIYIYIYIYIYVYNLIFWLLTVPSLIFAFFCFVLYYCGARANEFLTHLLFRHERGNTRIDVKFKNIFKFYQIFVSFHYS